MPASSSRSRATITFIQTYVFINRNAQLLEMNDDRPYNLTRLASCLLFAIVFQPRVFATRWLRERIPLGKNLFRGDQELMIVVNTMLDAIVRLYST